MDNADDVLGKEKNINVVNELIGLEVIDESAILVGVVKDIVWDFKINRIEALVVEEKGGSFFSRIGGGEKLFIPYERIQAIGDKVLIGSYIDETGSEMDLESYRLNI